MDDLTSTQHYRMEEIQREFLKYAPAYAQKEAQEAIDKVMRLQREGFLTHGLYYIVLADLVGSTKYASEHSNPETVRRIQTFVGASFDALNETKITSTGLFVKEIGDAVLWIFQHFPDVLRWRAAYGKILRICEEISSVDPFEIRTCIHLGEVFLDGVNPLSLAVSQTFKMEKSVGPNEIALTETAYHVAWPTIARAYHAFEECGAIELDGHDDPVSLYRLRIHDKDDIERITLEQLE